MMKKTYGAGLFMAASCLLWASATHVSWAELPGRLYAVLADYLVRQASESRRMSLAPESARYLVSECERRWRQWTDVGFNAAETVWNCSKLVEATLDRAATSGGPYTVPVLESALPPAVGTVSLRIVTQPPGARVRMRGKFVGSTPIDGMNIRAHVVYDFVLTKSGAGEKAVTFIANEFEAAQLLFVYLERRGP